MVMAFHLLLRSGASILEGTQSLLEHLGLRVDFGNSSTHFGTGVCVWLLFFTSSYMSHNPSLPKQKEKQASVAIFLW